MLIFHTLFYLIAHCKIGKPILSITCETRQNQKLSLNLESKKFTKDTPFSGDFHL